jgi:hypothetical protein
VGDWRNRALNSSALKPDTTTELSTAIA